ncbi:MAG: sugar phosphate isomerase/epimerase [Acidobacteria bacterium]|nr:sugar phosphate isomerase/epimerase [Acidobacteriota bacterium]MBI3424138.1 sugar phosphate isomerase/epimerase [Acidobacteriota bacterium]
MNQTRRNFLQTGTAACAGLALTQTMTRTESLAAYAAAKGVKFKLSAPDWSLSQEGKLGAVGLSKQIGFPGVQISIGHAPRGETITQLPLSSSALQKQYLDEAKKQGVAITSLCLEIMHTNGLKSDPLGEKWLAECIPIAKALGVRVILVPFFGKWAIKQQAEQDRVADILRNVAPQAEKLGVILGLENTISARENAAIMERSKSAAIKTYYDVGNSSKEGYNVVEEIRWLGKGRICEMHLKETPWEKYLGEGGVINFPAVIDVLADIGFDQWAQLETSCPSKNIAADFTRNKQFIETLIGKRNRLGSAAKA